MLQLLGEFNCKLDAKGRLKLPSHLISQLEDSGVGTSLVINRGFEKHLVLYPKKVWEKYTKEIDTLNSYDRENRKFIRYFYRGAQFLEPDKAGRVIINGRLQEFAGVDKDVVLFARGEQIELWDLNTYEALFGVEPEEDFISLAEKVMAKVKKMDNDDVS